MHGLGFRGLQNILLFGSITKTRCSGSPSKHSRLPGTPFQVLFILGQRTQYWGVGGLFATGQKQIEWEFLPSYLQGGGFRGHFLESPLARILEASRVLEMQHLQLSIV